MKEWKLSIFNIVDKRIKFYSQNTNRLPPKSNIKANNRNWSNQKANPTLKPKREINQYYKLTKYNKNKLLTERAAISQKVATQQPKLN